MQATFHTLPRLLAASALMLGLAACSLPDLAGSGPGPAARAERQSRQGDHRAAALTYESAARAAAAGRQNGLWQSAATEWLALGDAAAAESALAQVDAPVSVEDSRAQRRLAAEVALLRGKPARALELLGNLQDGTDAAALETASRALFASGRTGEAVRALIDRERLVAAPQARRDNQRLIIDGVIAAARRGADLRPPAGADAQLAGWLELGRILADASDGGPAAQRRLRVWRSRYPAHPADPDLWRSLVAQPAAADAMPRQVALLLPLTGRAESAGAAVRDGFLAAYYDLDAASRPQLRVYDIGSMDAPSAYLQAIADGCDFVVGPLTREEVAGLASIADGRAMTLALNFLPDGTVTPDRFFQFALSPEDEARQAASRALADGLDSAVALVPQTGWGRRVLAAFSESFAAGGGRLVGQDSYTTETTDFNEVLRRLLRTTGQRGSTPRPDARFIFIAGQPVHGRLLRSQLRFNYASDLPVYSTSDVYDPGGRGNGDLNGVIFPDMPWVLDPAGPAAAARESVERVWPDGVGGRNRLHAFGYDAFRLMGQLRGSGRATPAALEGVTGRLTFGPDGRIHRELNWAQVVDGRALLLPPPARTAGTGP